MVSGDRDGQRARARGRAASDRSGAVDVIDERAIARLTYRTVRVLRAIAHSPGAGNRQIGRHAGIGDEGQVCKLLQRLEREGYAQRRTPRPPGGPNAWYLTPKGELIEAVGSQLLERLPRRKTPAAVAAPPGTMRRSARSARTSGKTP